jgi:hypothetical protein
MVKCKECLNNRVAIRGGGLSCPPKFSAPMHAAVLSHLMSLSAACMHSSLLAMVYLLNKGGHTTLATSPEYKGVHGHHCSLSIYHIENFLFHFAS